MLIRLLTSNDRDVLLRTLEVMITDADTSLLEGHLDTVLPLLLKLTTYPHSMDVRISSLQCLMSMSEMSTPLLVPHMSVVIDALLAPLDDKKRIVRMKAVTARNTWSVSNTELGILTNLNSRRFKVITRKYRIHRK